jgi:hypothetical protein
MSDNFSQKVIGLIDKGVSVMEISKFFGGLKQFIQKVSQYPYLKALVDSKLGGNIEFYLDDLSKRYRLPVQIKAVEEADNYFGEMYDVYVDVIIPEVTDEVDIAILYNYLKMYEDDTAETIDWALLNDKKLYLSMTMVHVLSINGIDWRDMKRVINTTEEDVERIIPDEYKI